MENVLNSNMNKVFISIVMPVYGVADYISNSIQSVIQQTCENFELILVDDNGPDNSIEIAEKLLKNSTIRYQIVVDTDKDGNPKNNKLPGARNFGAEKATGEWIVFIDSDDCMHPDFLSTYVINMEDKIDFIFSDFSSVDKSQALMFKVKERLTCPSLSRPVFA